MNTSSKTPVPERKKMPAEVFVSLLARETVAEGTEWSDSVVIGKDYMVLTNLEVDKIVRIESNKKPMDFLRFSNVQLKELDLIYVVTHSLSIDENSQIENLSIRSKSNIEKFAIYGSRLDNVLIDDSQLGNFSITENATIKEIQIRNNSVAGDFEIYDSKVFDSIIVDNSNTGDIKVLDSKTGNLCIKGTLKNKETQLFPDNYDSLLFLRNFSLGEADIFSTGVEGNNFSINKGSFTGNITIANSKIGDIQIFGMSQTGDFWISKKSSVKDFSITENSTVGSISITEKSFTNDFLIAENSNVGSLLIHNSKIGIFRVRENSDCNALSIKMKSSVTDFILEDDSNLGDFTIEASKMGDINICRSRTNNLLIYASEIAKLNIYEKSNISRMVTHLSLMQGIEIRSNCYINYLRLQFLLQESIHVLFENCKFNYLDFENTVSSETTTLTVSNCEINHLNFHNFCNYGTVFFSNLRPFKINTWEAFKNESINQMIFLEGGYFFETESQKMSILRMTDSDLGSMQFINCDLSEFNRFEYSNTKMLNVFAAATIIPSDNIFCFPQNYTISNRELVEQKRIAYGQFKKIYEVRGDIAGSLPYLAYEMEAYRQQLQMEGWWKNRGELTMMWMNKLSTNYGVSWQRGLLATLIVTTFFYWTFCYLIGYRFEYDSPDDFERFKTVVSYAPYYLNPLRDLDSVFLLPDKDFTPAARIWDFVSRIFVAYFVYQTIQAFRKLGKSSG